MSKRIDDKTFERFVKDVKHLRSTYTDARIAMKMKLNAGNFSSYVNGSKRPGQDVIDRFYRAWGKEITEMDTADSNEPKQDFPGYAAEILHQQDERLQRIEENITRLDSSIKFLMEKLLVSNQKLIDAHLSIVSQAHQSKAS